MTDYQKLSIDDPEPTLPSDGIGLCLSGGGYRAMLFHLGAFWRLHEIGMLKRIDRVSSVSGGSIAASVLAMAWGKLGSDGNFAQFRAYVVEPLRKLASTTLDAKAIIGGMLLVGEIGEHLANAYDKHLFGGASLADLPDSPCFTFNATNLETGALWRFSKELVGDYRVGTIFAPRLRIAEAVAASSAFPPFLSPLVLKVRPEQFDRVPDGLDDSYRQDISLTDGGVYDNLGLESAFKTSRTLLVSDGGGRITDDATPPADWARASKRVLDVVDHQVRNLRKRQLIGALASGNRQGAYWGIRTDIDDYGIGDAFGCPHVRTLALAETPTRLAAMDDGLQERLINWGYAVCDTALRRHVDPAIALPAGLPYPESEI